MTAPARVTQAQIKRAVKGALEAGLPVGCVEVTADGTIRLLPDAPKQTVKSAVDNWFGDDAG